MTLVQRQESTEPTVRLASARGTRMQIATKYYHFKDEVKDPKADLRRKQTRSRWCAPHPAHPLRSRRTIGEDEAEPYGS